MESTVADWERIFEDMDSDRTVVIIAQIDPNLSELYRMDLFKKLFRTNPADVFEKYGVIKAARYGLGYGRDKSYAHFFVILFRDAADATNLIKVGALTVHETDVMVLPFRSHDKLIETIQQMTFAYRTLHTAPANSEENILNVLNDDCLREIFQRIVHLPDIMSIRNVCSRFRQVAEKAFISLFKRKTISFKELNPFGNVTLADIEKFLRRFGPSICSITHSHLITNTMETLELLNKHCPNLKSLELLLRQEDIDERTVIEIRPLLSKLSSLTVQHRLLSVCNHLISPCTELEKLHVAFDISDSVLPDIKFSKLKDFGLFNKSEMPLNGFLAQHQQIEKLDVMFHPGIGRIIFEELPNVRELRINGHFVDISMLDSHYELAKLRRTNISVRGVALPRVPQGESVVNLFKLKNVTRLELLPIFTSTNFDIVMKLMKDFWHLEELEINFKQEDYYPEQTMLMDRIKEMLQHAKKLTKLNIEWPVGYLCYFQEKDYSEILLTVKNRGDSLKLDIKSSCCEGNGSKYFRRSFQYLNTDARLLTITNEKNMY